MSTEYTPTTLDVAFAYQVAGGAFGDYAALANRGAKHRPEFDRWLADHDKALRAKIAGEVKVRKDRYEALGPSAVADPNTVLAAFDTSIQIALGGNDANS